MAPSRGKLPPQQAADAYAISWLGYFKSRELERAFRIEYHRHTWLRRFWSSVALLAVQAWFLGQYYVRNLATPTIQAMLIVNLAFLLLQFLLETSLLLSRYQSKGASTPSKRGLYERLAGSGFLDFLWCCTITFAVTALDVTVFNLCSDPALSLRAPFACAAYKISTLPSAPFVICTGAAALVPLLSVAIIPNLAAVLAAFGLTAAQWAAFYVTPPPPPGLPPGSFSSNVLRTGALIILLFLLNFLVLLTLSLALPIQYRSSYAAQMQAEDHLRRYQQESARSARLQEAASKAQLALVRVVSDSTIGFLGHASRNPLHALSALIDDLDSSVSAALALSGGAATLSGTALPAAKAVATTAEREAEVTPMPRRQPVAAVEEGGAVSSVTGGAPAAAARPRPRTRSASVAVTIDPTSVHSMRECVQQMAVIIDQASYYTALLSGRTRLHNRQPVEVRPLMNDVVTSTTAQVPEAGLGTIPLYVAPSVPPFLHIDEPRLRDALQLGLSYAIRQSRKCLGTPPRLPQHITEALMSAGFSPAPISVRAYRVWRPSVAESDLRDPFAVIADGSRGSAYGEIPPTLEDGEGLNSDNSSGLEGVQVSVAADDQWQQQQQQQRHVSLQSQPPVSANPAAAEDSSKPRWFQRRPPAAAEVLPQPAQQQMDTQKQEEDQRPRLRPFIRYEICAVGCGLPEGESARTLFSPFLQALDRASLRALRQLPISSRESADSYRSLMAAVAPEEADPAAINVGGIEEEGGDVSGGGGGVGLTGTHPLAVGADSAAAGSMAVEPPPSPTHNAPVINVPAVPTERHNDGGNSGTSSADSAVNNDGTSTDDDEGRQLLVAGAMQQGLHAHTRHSGLALAIIHMIAQLMRGYCGIFDDPAVARLRILVLSSSSSSQPKHAGATGTAASSFSADTATATTTTAHPTLPHPPHPQRWSDAGRDSGGSDSQPTSADSAGSSSSSDSTGYVGGPTAIVNVTRLFIEVPEILPDSAEEPQPAPAEAAAGGQPHEFEALPIEQPQPPPPIFAPAAAVSLSPVSPPLLSPPPPPPAAAVAALAPFPPSAPPHGAPPPLPSLPLPPITTPAATVRIGGPPRPRQHIRGWLSAGMQSPILAPPPTAAAPPGSTAAATTAVAMAPSPFLQQQQPQAPQRGHMASHLISSAVSSASTSESTQPSPLTPATAAATATSAVAPPPAAAAATNNKPLRGMRVLAVDDEKLIRRINQRMLTKAGAEADTADDGDRVLPMVRSAVASGRPYDAVVMDIIMTRVNGDVACRQLRQAGFTALPVIAASGNVSVTDVDTYLSIGFSDVLGKPFSMGQLTETLLWLTGRREEEGGSAAAAAAATATTGTGTVTGAAARREGHRLGASTTRGGGVF